MVPVNEREFSHPDEVVKVTNPGKRAGSVSLE